MTLLRYGVALALAGSALVLAVPASARQFGCHSVKGYHVNAIERTDDIGTVFAVKTRRPGERTACEVTESGADFVVGANDPALWYADIVGHFLIMTRSTGPQGDVVIFDLDKRAYVLDVPADEVVADEHGATYWERVETGTPDNCQPFSEYQSNGLGAAIVDETRFDFESGVSRRTGQSRCDPTR